MLATDTGETSGRRSISRPRSLSPKGRHSNISADRKSNPNNVQRKCAHIDLVDHRFRVHKNLLVIKQNNKNSSKNYTHITMKHHKQDKHFTYRYKRPHRKEKYQNTDNTHRYYSADEGRIAG